MTTALIGSRNGPSRTAPTVRPVLPAASQQAAQPADQCAADVPPATTAGPSLLHAAKGFIGEHYQRGRRAADVFTATAPAFCWYGLRSLLVGLLLLAGFVDVFVLSAAYGFVGLLISISVMLFSLAYGLYQRLRRKHSGGRESV